MVTTFHRIWLGDKTIPEAYEHYWAAWQRQFPEHHFVTWLDADVAQLDGARDALARLSSPVSRSDLARYAILHEHGGIYLDCDIMPWQHFAPADLTRQLTICNEDASTDYCSIGFIGTPPAHPVFRELIDHIAARDIDESRPNVTTGPWLFGAFVKRHAHRRLPTNAFYPYLYDEPLSAIRTRDLDHTLGIHIWGGSWLDPSIKQTKAFDLIATGDIAEPAAILDGYDDEWSTDVKVLIDTIHDVRGKSAQAALVLNQDMTIDPRDHIAFEFSRLVHWLLERDPDRMVWQIGAADGTLVDPLRTAMVNFDPPALLLEPNPYMFAALEGAYRNNRNATLLPLAYAMGEDELILNAVNPAKAAAIGLPRWVLGISSIYDDRNALGGKTIDAETTRAIQTCVEKIAVATIGYDALLERSAGRLPDILVIDAEGMDKPIIDDIVSRGCRPAVIHFEIQCMERDEQDALTASLSDDYVLLTFGNDVTAYRNDVILDYATSLYVDHGIPTIFRPGLEILNGLR